MAKTAARRPAKAPAKRGSGGVRPVLLAAGLGLFWYVQYQDGGASDGPMWTYAMITATRLLADFVGAWVVVSAAQLLLALSRLAVAYLRGLWVSVG